MRPERGVALLSVLFVLVLLAMISFYMADAEFLALRRTSNVQDAEQAWQLVRGSEAWALRVLERDRRGGDTDHLGEPWRRLGPPVRVEAGELLSTAEDLQGRFNLNNLSAGRDKVWYPAFQRLLTLLKLDPGLADAVIDWIDRDQEPSGAQGAEDATYLLAQPPYRAADRPFAVAGELRWVAGFTPKALAVLLPYVTALPAANVAINVNTCSPVLLRVMARVPLSEADGVALADGRGPTGYLKVEDFLRRPELAGKADTAARLASVASNFFLVTSTAHYGRVDTSLQSVVQRGAPNAPAVVIERLAVMP